MCKVFIESKNNGLTRLLVFLVILSHYDGLPDLHPGR